MVEFKYPWLPPKCQTCSKWGHLKEVCLLNKRNQISETMAREDLVNNVEVGTEQVQCSATVTPTENILDVEKESLEPAQFSALAVQESIGNAANTELETCQEHQQISMATIPIQEDTCVSENVSEGSAMRVPTSPSDDDGT